MNVEQRFQQWAESYHRNGYLHGSILVASRGVTLLNSGFGMASHEYDSPNTSETKFRIGSLTKAFTAAAILQLHERKKLRLEDPISKYVPEFPHHQVTIYHCLTSTSGIPDFIGFPDFWIQTMRLPIPVNDIISSFKDLDLNFPPGTRFQYSTSGYLLLTKLIESISGLAYGEYMQKNIFEPLGMTDSGCDNGRTIVPGLATGYSFWEKPVRAEFADLSFPTGGYGLYSTVNDLYTWHQALQNHTLISRDSTETMFKAYHDSYACGWMVTEKMGRRCYHHFGTISGYYSNILRFPEEDAVVIFLSNMNVSPVEEWSDDLAKLLFDIPVALPYPFSSGATPKPEAFTGIYETESGERQVEITHQNNELYLTTRKMYGVPYKFKLHPVYQEPGRTVFQTEMIFDQWVLHHRPSGEIGKAEYIENGTSSVFMIKKL